MNSITDKAKGSRLTTYSYNSISRKSYGANPKSKILYEEYDFYNNKRTYDLQRLKMSALSRTQYEAIKARDRDILASNADFLSISSLFDFVNTYDKEFKPNPVNEGRLNEEK